MKEPIKILRVGKKKIQVWHDNFEYYQPNDHICGDCGIRAVSKALDTTWDTALAILYLNASRIKEPPDSCDNITDSLRQYDFKWVYIKPKKGKKQPTVAEFAKSHYSGTYICRVSNHVVCVRDGKYHDIWDCGDKSLYGYWEKV